MAGPRETTRTPSAPSAPLGLPVPEPAAVAGEASGARRGPRIPTSLEWEARAAATPRRHGPSLLEARAGALEVDEVAMAGRRWRDGAVTDREGL
jgi:hypothetical protein